MGSLGDFIRKTARDAVHSKLNTFSTETQGSASGGKSSGGWFVGKTNPERTTITDPSNNKTYSLTYTGQIQEVAVARVTSPTTAYAYGNPPRYQPNVDWDEKKYAYAVFDVIYSYPTPWDSLFYVAKFPNEGDPDLYTLDAFTIVGVDPDNDPWWNYFTRFSPDGKHMCEIGRAHV